MALVASLNSLAALLLVSLLIVAAEAQQAQQGTAAAGTIYAERRSISQNVDFAGRIQSIDGVDIQARVTGYLELVLFKEGDFVKQGARPLSY